MLYPPLLKPPLSSPPSHCQQTIFLLISLKKKQEESKENALILPVAKSTGFPAAFPGDLIQPTGHGYADGVQICISNHIFLDSKILCPIV